MGGSHVLGVFLAISIAVSGCAGGAAAPESTDQPQPSSVNVGDEIDGGGTVQGIVTDDSLQPLGRASVGILETGSQATTSEAGGFEFKNVPAGTYTLVAQRLGYKSIARSITVIEGETTQVALSLVALAIEEMYLEIVGPQNWFFDCRVGTPVLTGPCGVSTPNDKSSMTFKMTADVEDFIGELRWQPGTFASTKMLRLSLSYQGRPNTHWYCTATTTSPVKMEYQMEEGCISPRYCGIASSQGTTGDHSKPNTKETLLMYTNTPFGCTGDPTHIVELSIQQKLEAIMTMVHNGLAPADYTAFPDV